MKVRITLSRLIQMVLISLMGSAICVPEEFLHSPNKGPSNDIPTPTLVSTSVFSRTTSLFLSQSV